MARLITGLTPTREQALQERMFLQIARKYENLIRREIARAMRAIARNDKDATLIHEQRMSDVLTRLYKESFKMFGRRLLNSFAKHEVGHETKKDVPKTPQFDLARQIWIRTQAALAVTQITGTTEKQSLEIIRRALDESIEQGLTEAQTGRLIQARINESGGQLSRLRGRMISRTESHASSNVSNQMAAQSTRLPLKKEWIASGGERTRLTHFIAAQQGAIDIGQPFVVGADLLMQCGDPSGSPEEVINCFTGDTSVSFASCKKSIRSTYTGELITIETPRGHKLTGTPNHPVLTDTGFIRLGDVNHSTNLICCDINKGFKSVDFNVDYIPTQFEELHNSIAVIGVVVREVRATVNLYGRIVNSNVNIVSPHLMLRNTGKAANSKGFYKLILKLANFRKGAGFADSLFNSTGMVKIRRFISNGFMRSADLISSFFVTHPRPFNGLGFGLTSGGYSSIRCNGANTSPSNAQLLADSVLTNPGGVKTTNQSVINDFFGPLVSKFSNNVFDKGSTNPKVFSALGVTLSSHAHIENALSIVKSSHVDTYVYTLETDEGFYNSGGIIAQNCRCAVGYSL